MENAVERDLEAEREGNSVMDLSDFFDLLRTDTTRLLPTPCEFSSQHRALLKENVDEVVAKVCSALEKSTFNDFDTTTLSSDDCLSTISTEVDGDDHKPDKGIINRRQGHCSLKLEEMPPHANAFTGALPGRGHTSSPPNLDATWTLTSHFENFPNVSDFSAEDLEGMTEEWFWWHCLDSYSEAKSESESRCESPR
ncbi:hypothetical protein GGI43DRAFT_383295 [Trichoderma evansii]